VPYRTAKFKYFCQLSGRLATLPLKTLYRHVAGTRRFSQTRIVLVVTTSEIQLSVALFLIQLASRLFWFQVVFMQRENTNNRIFIVDSVQIELMHLSVGLGLSPTNTVCLESQFASWICKLTSEFLSTLLHT